MPAIKSYRPVSIQVLKRMLLPPSPGSMEPKHEYAVLLTTRADVKTRSGANEFAKVDIGGKTVTHTFSIRYTTIAIDGRCRVRDARGHLYQILAVDNVDEANREIRIHCSNQGDETVEAAR